MATIVVALRRVYEIAEKALLIAGTLTLVLWAVKPTREWLERRLFFDASTIAAVMAFVVLLVYKTLITLQKSFESAQRPAPLRILGKGVSHVYPMLSTMVGEVGKSMRQGDDACRFEVLGLTLFTAWPYLEGELLRSDLNGWRFRLLCLSPEFIRQNPDVFDLAWASEAEAKIDQIKSYIVANTEELRRREIQLEVRTYAGIPAVHGFCVGGAEIVMAFAHWGKNDRLRPPYDFYDCVVGTDHSERANVYRHLFRNWFEHSLKHSQLVASVPADPIAGNALPKRAT